MLWARIGKWHMAEQDRMKAALLAAIANSTEPMVLSDARLPDMPMIAVNTISALTRGLVSSMN